MYVETNQEIFDEALEKFADSGQIFNLLLFRFKEQALYANGTDLPPATGREVYFQRYLPAITEVASKVLPGGQLGEVLFAGEFQAMQVGPKDEKWDFIALIKWPSIREAHLLNTHSEYERLAAPHRFAAMADMRVILTTQFSIPA